MPIVGDDRIVQGPAGDQPYEDARVVCDPTFHSHLLSCVVPIPSSAMSGGGFVCRCISLHTPTPTTRERLRVRCGFGMQVLWRSVLGYRVYSQHEPFSRPSNPVCMSGATSEALNTRRFFIGLDIPAILRYAPPATRGGLRRVSSMFSDLDEHPEKSLCSLVSNPWQKEVPAANSNEIGQELNLPDLFRRRAHPPQPRRLRRLRPHEAPCPESPVPHRSFSPTPGRPRP